MFIVETEDYEEGPFRVIFGAGDTNVSFPINTFSDTTLEGVELFAASILSINSSVAMKSNPDTTIVAIIDNSSKC